MDRKQQLIEELAEQLSALPKQDRAAVLDLVDGVQSRTFGKHKRYTFLVPVNRPSVQAPKRRKPVSQTTWLRH